MTCGTFTVSKVPAGQVQQTEDLFKANDPPPTSVSSAPDGSGTFKVTAVFPPCPDNTTHDPSNGSC
jgi:hypothetical protein